ncbi:hypothetical protein [Nitrincola sp. MINF-07-Sa-05]|uniref:hypothetical protein n=1 Tax=Nitrincola salilacus TaxID=3400273 RepID=UPI0039183B1A
MATSSQALLKSGNQLCKPILISLIETRQDGTVYIQNRNNSSLVAHRQDYF